MEMKKIVLVANSDVAAVLYQGALDEYNRSLNEATYIITQQFKSRKDFLREPPADDAIVFVDVEMADGNGLELVQILLAANPQLHVLILCEPKDLKEAAIIGNWTEQYPLAVIGRVIKPFQPSAIWEFLKSTEEAMPRFEITDFDWDGNWGESDGME